MPEILLSGDHAAVARWRRKEALRRTRSERPDLLASHVPTSEDRTLLAELDAESSEAPMASVAARAPVYVGLVHHPVRDREGQIVTTAVTNLDVHDLARSSRSYGLSGYFVITPIEAQRELVGKILEHWIDGSGKRRVPERAQALSLCESIDSIDAAAREIEQRHGRPPRIVVTAAKAPDGALLHTPASVRAQMRTGRDPWLLLFGTGHGLAPEVTARADVVLTPIRPGAYNHLSVRAACAIMLDRLFGDEGA